MNSPAARNLAQLIEVAEMLSHDLLLQPSSSSEEVARKLEEATQHARALNQVLMEVVRFGRAAASPAAPRTSHAPASGSQSH